MYTFFFKCVMQYCPGRWEMYCYGMFFYYSNRDRKTTHEERPLSLFADKAISFITFAFSLLLSSFVSIIFHHSLSVVFSVCHTFVVVFVYVPLNSFFPSFPLLVPIIIKQSNK